MVSTPQFGPQTIDVQRTLQDALPATAEGRDGQPSVGVVHTLSMLIRIRVL